MFKARALCTPIALFILFLSCVTTTHGEQQKDTSKQKHIEDLLSRQTGGALLISDERLTMLPVKKIIAEMQITPGMEIVDIGAGTGIFTFSFAETLKGTGHVYATEIHNPNIDYIKQEAEKRGYHNITPVLVRGTYDPSFYQKHSFDRIFMCDVLPFIWRPRYYFRELRPSLKPGTGRLYIIEPRVFSPFSELDLGDFRKFACTLKKYNADFPVFQKLSPDVQKFYSRPDTSTPPPEIQKKTLQDLNRILADRDLFEDLTTHYYQKNGCPHTNNITPLQSLLYLLDTDTARLIKQMVSTLDETGAFDKEAGALSPEEQLNLRKLNKLLICLLLNIDSLSFRMEFRVSTVILRSKANIISSIEAAGYKLVADHDDILPKYYFLEFKRND